MENEKEKMKKAFMWIGITVVILLAIVLFSSLAKTIGIIQTEYIIYIQLVEFTILAISLILQLICGKFYDIVTNGFIAALYFFIVIENIVFLFL